MNNEYSKNGAVIPEIELSYQPSCVLASLPSVQTSRQAYTLFISTWDKRKIQFVEQFKVMLLTHSQRLIGICTISSGSSCGTMADPRLVFIAALKGNAESIILAHNHPSGDILPSLQDRMITEQLEKAGKFLDISVTDHVIIAPDQYYSFADEGYL